MTERAGARFSWPAYLVGVLNGVAIAGGVLVAVLLGSSAAARDGNDLADQFGVSIVWSTAAPGCGDYGCFHPATPDTIYVSPDMDAQTTRFIILHELGHVIQHRLGQPIDECNADAFARLMGGVGTGYGCVSDGADL